MTPLELVARSFWLNTANARRLLDQGRTFEALDPIETVEQIFVLAVNPALRRVTESTLGSLNQAYCTARCRQLERLGRRVANIRRIG